MNFEERNTSDVFFFTRSEKREARYKIRTTTNKRRTSGGFTILAVIGILAIMTIMASVMVPNLATLLDQQATDFELNNLQAIAQGSEVYLRQNFSWPPTLAAHSPDYVSLDVVKLLQNPRGYPRYFFVHPTTSGFSNSMGLAESQVPNLRFLLVSDLSQDASAVVNNSTDFENWWQTPKTSDLHIYKGNVGSLFHKVALSAKGNGGSYQINGTATGSGGGLLASYSRYHVKGTVIGLDEAVTYGTPDLLFTLTTSVAYEFVPCFPSGTRWRVPPTPPCPVLWLSTTGNANGTPGLSTWNDAQVVAFIDPDLTYEPGPTGATSGNFGLSFDLENFVNNADVDAIHYVTRPITVGSTNTVALFEGDLLLSTDRNEFLTSTNSLFVRDEDVFVFRPTSVGDYSSGTFLRLLDGSDLSLVDVKAITLVEQNGTVGDTGLSAGSFLLSDQDNDVLVFVPTSVGTTTGGTISLLIDGSDININTTKHFHGLHLIGEQTKIGDVTLTPGQILATLNRNDNSVGDNSISTRKHDIFILDLTTAGSNTAGNATLLFDGSDVSLKNNGENLDGLTLNGRTSYQQFSLPIVNPGFEAGDLSGWTKTGDLFENGGINHWGAVTSAGAMSTPHGGTYFAGGRATGPIGTGPHMTGLYQRLNVSAYSTEIDLGTATVTIAGYGHGETGQDKVKLRIAFYDAVSGGNQLGSNVDSNEATQSETWTALAISGNAVPVGTRSIELLLLGEKINAGSYLDAGIDDVSATLIYP